MLRSTIQWLWQKLTRHALWLDIVAKSLGACLGCLFSKSIFQGFVEPKMPYKMLNKGNVTSRSYAVEKRKYFHSNKIIAPLVRLDFLNKLTEFTEQNSVIALVSMMLCNMSHTFLFDHLYYIILNYNLYNIWRRVKWAETVQKFWRKASEVFKKPSTLCGWGVQWEGPFLRRLLVVERSEKDKVDIMPAADSTAAARFYRHKMRLHFTPWWLDPGRRSRVLKHSRP